VRVGRDVEEEKMEGIEMNQMELSWRKLEAMRGFLSYQSLSMWRRLPITSATPSGDILRAPCDICSRGSFPRWCK
jgi:hypothetical protein